LEPLACGEIQDEYASFQPLLKLAIRKDGKQGKYWGGGVKTNRDFLLVAFSRNEIEMRLKALCDSKLDTQAVKEMLNLKDGDYWNTEREREKLCGIDWRARIFPYFYGPFDIRYVAHISQLIEIKRGGASKHLMKHYQELKNVGLVLKRRNLDSEYHHVFVTCCSVDINSLSGQTYTIPLKLAGTQQVALFENSHELSCATNFGPGRMLFSELMGPGAKVDENGIFNYIYAILHSPFYRSRYAGELQQDFPHLPLTSNFELFFVLAGLGGELVALHLLESSQLDRFITSYIGPKNPEVGRVTWSDDTVWLDAGVAKKGQPSKLGTIGFRGVTEKVWNFYIGGYQVCHKWLKDRKGRTLSDDDISHYQKIIVALNETIRLMAEIDKVIDAHGGWPGAFVTDKGGAK
jgi:predicted helicase